MRKIILRFSLLLFLTSLLALSSCGGGDTTTDTTAKTTGTVGILLTDKPADPSLFSAINATIVKVELMPSDDDGDRISLYNGDPQTFNLLRLKNEAIPVTFNDDVPVGSYCKIRLTLSNLELVLADNTPDDASDNETHHPHLSGNGKLDIVARDCFDVEEGRVVTLQLDIDAGKSIHVTGDDKKYHFRPVIFIDVISKEFNSKLVRLDGVISRVDLEHKTLLLCKVVPAQHSDSLGCVKVHLGDDSAFFDNLEHAGAPRSIDELLSDSSLDEDATVVGWARHLVDRKGDDDDDEHHPWMEIDALVVELGEFLQVEGEVSADADIDGFGMAVTAAGPVITETTLDVVLQAGSPGINGTRIVSKSGDLLDHTQITIPRPVQVDGVLELVADSDAMLKAALVIVDTDTQGGEQVTGTILSIGVGNLTISPEADSVCGISSNQLFVTLADDVDLLTVVITDDGSEITPGGNFEVGQTIGMNGSCESNGYVTDNVVIVDDQR